MIEPIEGKVLIKLIDDELVKSIKENGLILPSVADEKALGEGIAVNGEFKDKKVYFKKYTGEEIEYENSRYYIVDEEDLIAYLK